MTALVLLGGLLVFLLLGVPVAMSLGLSSAIVMVLMTDQSMMSLALKFAHTMKVYPLLAIPFFILAGTLMSTGGVAKRMINFAIASVGHFRGGLAMASVFSLHSVCCRIRFITSYSVGYRTNCYRRDDQIWLQQRILLLALSAMPAP